MRYYLVAACLHFGGANAWEWPHHQSEMGQVLLGGGDDDVDIVTGSQFNGLRTFANVPYLNCFSDNETAEHKYDIAFIGAPHDTVSLRQPA